ncbi:vacuolar sorting protein 39-like [Papaver somniferum]|uniref:vacuolar sorting protein 39-like n=1 Tax=Papaver somniferum TaxID=3469 RepID=UPI000E6F7396|nr:vacuolar sorting protein 39-like [Papaver somniferum]
MVHSAYDSLELLQLKNNSTKIQSVGSYGSKILVGCADGSMLIYVPSSTDPRSPTSSSSTSSDIHNYHHCLELRKDSYVLEKSLTGFSKKPLISMEVSTSRELLVSLSESISFHGLPNLETIAVITKAKGANLFSWDDRRGYLCFSRQKRVCIFRHDGGRGFVEVKEYGVPDVVKSMSWCGENICLGIRRDYTILNTVSGAFTEVFPSGRTAPPLVVSLPSGELLLGKDNIGVFVDQNGKLLQEGRICWSEAPLAVLIHRPYVIAHLPRHIEIRSLRAPYPLVQTVALRSVHHLLQSNNCVIAALDNSVTGLFPVSIGAQIVQLTASGNFGEALALCKMLPPEDSTLRAAKEESIHIRYGHYLFNNGSYEEAMEQFWAAQVEFTYVLSLYPSIILPKSMLTPDMDKEADVSWDDSYLSRVSSDASEDMDPTSPSYLESERNPVLESKKMSHNTLMALIKYLQRKRCSIVERATVEGTEEILSDAMGERNMAYDFDKSNISHKGRRNIQVSSGSREMAAVLDTALIQALLLTGQSLAALELLKGPNYCDLKITEEFLQQSNYYTALLELYRCNMMHREALELLYQLVEESKADEAQSELKQNFRPDTIIQYLKPLCSTEPMLVLEFSMHVLESCPTEAIDLFLSGNIPPDLVNSYLKQHAPKLQATYLELMLSRNESEISGNLQNEMVQIYLSEVLDSYEDLKRQNKWDEQTYSSSRKKLLSALQSISGYSPEGLLKRLPADALYEERAVLLGKMNQHQLALSLYVHKLHVPELALAYCDRVYETGQKKPSPDAYGNIYLTLLQIYLNPQKSTKDFEKRILNPIPSKNVGTKKVRSLKSNKWNRAVKKIAEIEGAEDIRFSPSSTDSGRSDGDEPILDGTSTIMIDEVLDLLGQRWDRVHGAQALKLLPRETKLQNLLPFLGPLLKKSSEAQRNLSVIKSLRSSENLQVKDELYKHRKTVMKISNDSMCSLCNKKIGTSVFAVYPNGKTLVHFVCFKDSQSMKTMVKGTPLRKQGY